MGIDENILTGGTGDNGTRKSLWFRDVETEPMVEEMWPVAEPGLDTPTPMKIGITHGDLTLLIISVDLVAEHFTKLGLTKSSLELFWDLRDRMVALKNGGIDD